MDNIFPLHLKLNTYKPWPVYLVSQMILHVVRVFHFVNGSFYTITIDVMY